MRKTALSLALTISLSLVSFPSSAISIFNGTTSDIDTKPYEKEITVTEKDENNKDLSTKAVLFDVAKFMGLKVTKGKDGKPVYDYDRDKVNALLKMSAPINVGMLTALESSQNGNLMFVSENQRYYFVGNMYDLFSGMRKVTSVDDIREFAGRVNYKKWNIDLNTLNSISIGSGTEEVAIWLIPDDPLNQRIIKEASDLSKKEPKYKFYFIVIPNFYTQDSFVKARNFYCARESGNNEIGTLLYTNRFSEIKPELCDLSGFEKTQVIKYMSGIDKVPFIVAPDGRISAGIPDSSLEYFLAKDPTMEMKSKTPTPAEIELKKALQKKIVEEAMFDDLPDDLKEQAKEKDLKADPLEDQLKAIKEISNKSVQPNPLNAPQEDFSALKKAEVEKIKKEYKPKLDKVERLIKYEERNYLSNRNRIQRAMDSAIKYDQNNPNHQQDLMNYQNKLSDIDAAYNGQKTKLNKQYQELKDLMNAEIEKVKNSDNNY